MYKLTDWNYRFGAIESLLRLIQYQLNHNSLSLLYHTKWWQCHRRTAFLIVLMPFLRVTLPLTMSILHLYHNRIDCFPTFRLEHTFFHTYTHSFTHKYLLWIIYSLLLLGDFAKKKIQKYTNFFFTNSKLATVIFENSTHSTFSKCLRNQPIPFNLVYFLSTHFGSHWNRNIFFLYLL